MLRRSIAAFAAAALLLAAGCSSDPSESNTADTGERSNFDDALVPGGYRITLDKACARWERNSDSPAEMDKTAAGLEDPDQAAVFRRLGRALLDELTADPGREELRARADVRSAMADVDELCS